MAVEDTWTLKDGKTPSKRHGRGLRYRVRWRGVPSRSFRTRKAAEAYWLKVRTETPAPTSDALVGDLVDRWLATKAGLSPKGREACQGAAAHVKARWEWQTAVEVLPSDVRAWIASLPGSGSLRVKILQCLSGVYKLAVADGLLIANPCEGVSVKPGQRREPRFLTTGELERLAVECGPVIWLLATTGMRIGEACALNVADVDLERHRLRVHRSSVASATTKTGKARDVPVSRRVLAMLDLDRPAAEPLLLSPSGLRLDSHNWRARVFSPATVRAGLPGVHPHDLRHTAASLAIASGADVKAVQRMLGHASATMTLDLYGHLFDKGLDDVAARMDALVPLS